MLSSEDPGSNRRSADSCQAHHIGEDRREDGNLRRLRWCGLATVPDQVELITSERQAEVVSTVL